MPRVAIAILIIMSRIIVSQAEDGEVLIFEGIDPLSDSLTSIALLGGGRWYFMDGQRMKELRHANMPSDGLASTVADRTGRLDNLYLLLPCKLDIFTRGLHTIVPKIACLRGH